MGRSVSTDVIYGYGLGGCEGEWDCLDYDSDSYSYKWPSWVVLGEDGYPDESEDMGFAHQMSKRLDAKFLETVGFTEPEPDWKNEQNDWYAYLDRRKNAKRLAGIDSGPGSLVLETAGAEEFRDYFLGISLESGRMVMELGYDTLNPTGEMKSAWNRMLRKAVEFLEVRPVALEPKFLVLATYG